MSYYLVNNYDVLSDKNKKEEQFKNYFFEFIEWKKIYINLKKKDLIHKHLFFKKI